MGYWKNVLKRVIAVIKKLGSRSFLFRGSVEKFGSQNNGNFMMCLKLISEFDPFLSNHIVSHAETRAVVIHLTFLLQHVMK